jgi:hypothetical protein
MTSHGSRSFVISFEQDSISLPRDAPDALPTPDTLESVSAELVAARREIAELKTAVVSNRNIGAATGILMARHSLTQQQAWDAMREESQRSHRKLRDVAEEVLFTGRLAGRPEPPSAPVQRSV